MKRNVTLLLLVPITLTAIAIAFIIGFYSIRSIKPKIEENIVSLQERLNLRFSAFSTIIEAEQTQLASVLEDSLPKLSEQLIQLDQPIEEIPMETLQQWVKEFPINEVYLIDHTGEIVNTTFAPDLHFNLTSISSEMTNFLQGIYGTGKVLTDRMSLSTKTGILNTYAYHGPKDKDYIVEVSVDMRDYIRQYKGEDYLDFLFRALFVDATHTSDIIVDLDMFMYNDLAAWSMTREGLSMEVDILHQLNEESQVRKYEGNQLTIYRRFTPQMKILAGYFNQELASKVTYNISEVRNTIIGTVILSALAILIIVPFMYWFTSHALQQRVIEPFTKRARELEHARRQAEDLALVDELTKLKNRRAFLELSKHILSEAKRYNHQVSLLIIDIDFFKKINDTFGHATGDEALRKISGVIQKSLRERDIPARLGGEEFAILLPETSVENAAALAERLRRRISCIELTVPNGAYRFTTSIGVVANDVPTSSLDNFLAKADEALYKAKELGRNQVVVL